MGDVTTLAKATSNSTTLRTSVPASIKKQFNLTEKDQLDWQMQAQQNEIVIVVKPIKRA